MVLLSIFYSRFFAGAVIGDAQGEGRCCGRPHCRGDGREYLARSGLQPAGAGDSGQQRGRRRQYEHSHRASGSHKLSGESYCGYADRSIIVSIPSIAPASLVLPLQYTSMRIFLCVLMYITYFGRLFVHTYIYKYTYILYIYKLSYSLVLLCVCM